MSLPGFLAGAGQMGTLIRQYPWSRTSLGSLDSWPPSLKTSIALILGSPNPLWIGWGSEMTFFYNDACAPLLGPARHPRAVGSPASTVWAEIWDVCGPLAKAVFERGESSCADDVRLFVDWGDFVEETFYSFSFSPIRDESGAVAGLFCPSTDTTRKVLSARRLVTVAELAANSRAEKTVAAACATAAKTLNKNPADVPFALLYLSDGDQRHATLAQSVGVAQEGSDSIDLGGPFGTSPWPIAEVFRSAQRQVVGASRVPGLPPGAAGRKVVEAVVLPVASDGERGPRGVLVAGVNPCRPLDSDYLTFFDLVACEIAAAMQNSRASEEENQRARPHQDQLEVELAESRLLQKVSAELIQEERVDSVYEKILDAVVAIMHSDFASMQMLYPERGEGGELRLLAFRGFSPHAAQFWEWVRPGSGSTCGAALRENRRVIAPDVEQADFMAGTDDLSTYLETGIRAVQTTPLISRSGRVLGMISTHWREPHQPRERELNMLDVVARQAADLIERRQAAEALARRTAQYQVLLNQAPLGVYVVDADLRILEANPTALVGFGPIPQLIGRDFDETIHQLWSKTHADEIVRIFRDTLATGEPHITPECIETRLGGDVTEYYEWQVHRIPLLDGRYGVVCYFRDISSQVLARIAIAESEQRFRFMAESMPQKIYTARPDGAIDYVNPQWLDFTGVSEELIKGDRRFELVHPEDAEESRRVWKDSIATGEPYQRIHRLRRADGAYRWHLARAQALRDAGGKIVMWIGSNTEIHEQKQIEEELRRLNQDLNQFAFAASHDLKEPLRMVTNYSALLRRNCPNLNSQAAVALRYIEEGAQRMEALISDLLAYTQVAVRSEEPLAPVDFNVALEHAAKNLDVAMRESGAALSGDPLPLIAGVHTHFVQLMQNLLGNAIKYRGPEAPRIHVGVEKQGAVWKFSVSDNGIGIEPEYHRTIFGVFKRLHRKDIAGTGIGLAICQRVVERYGGRIWVESDAGRGSTFYFTLPAE